MREREGRRGRPGYENATVHWPLHSTVYCKLASSRHSGPPSGCPLRDVGLEEILGSHVSRTSVSCHDEVAVSKTPGSRGPN